MANKEACSLKGLLSDDRELGPSLFGEIKILPLPTDSRESESTTIGASICKEGRPVKGRSSDRFACMLSGGRWTASKPENLVVGDCGGEPPMTKRG